MCQQAVFLVLMGSSLWGQVSFERILAADQEPENWLTYSGSFLSQRHSLLEEITPENAGDLRLQWVFQARSFEAYEATPLVVDGVMYTIQNPNDVVALDAATGRVFWTFSHPPDAASRPCCGRLNRGLAILGDTLFMGTIDARLIAIDTRNGRPLWNVQVGNPEAGYAITHAPLVIEDKVLVGMAGGEFGIRGYIAAFDAATGEEVWRFYTIPGPGEPGNETWAGDSWRTGGASVWVTGSYDAELNLTYWGIGNPGPDWNGEDRGGDNLYSDSVVALDADTGELRWHYQFTPHDEFDYDSVQIPVLVDMDWEGRPRQLMLWANRNGLFYVLDRSTGEFLMGEPFVRVTWMNGFDDPGRPLKIPSAAPTPEGTQTYPGVSGGTNWYSPSYSPSTRLFYVPVWDDYSSLFVSARTEYQEGQWFFGGAPGPPPGEPGIPFDPTAVNYRDSSEGYGAVRALDPQTGQMQWEFRMSDVTDAGILTTTSDVLFSGGREGHFYALDARDGELLWRVALGGRVTSGPITYMANGRQYVAVCAGNSLFAFTLGR